MTRITLALLLNLLVSTAFAAEIGGTLTLVFGDQAPGAAAAETMRVEVTGDDGSRYALDADAALASAADLYALNGLPVRVRLDGAAKRGAALAPARIEADPLARDFDLRAKQAGTAPQTWVVLLCRFADVAAEPKSAAHFDDLFGYDDGQLGDYFDRMSEGAMSIRGAEVVGWNTLPSPRADYLKSSGYANLDKLFRDCVDSADAVVDFNRGGEGVGGILMMFNANLDCCAWGGRVRTEIDGLDDAWRVAWLPPFAYENAAGLAHEIGHTLGLPHSNNSDGDSNTYDNPWDLMSDSYGYAERDTRFGRLPKGLAAHQRAQLGWLAPERTRSIDREGSHRLVLHARDSGRMNDAEYAVIEWPRGSGRRIGIEVRQQASNYDGALPADAVIVHELDSQRREPGWSVDADAEAADYADNAGSIFEPGERWVNADGSVELRVLAAAEGGFELDVTIRSRIFGDRFGG